MTRLMLGPGTSITHAAMRVLAECGCSVLWVGGQGVRCYAQGLGGTRSAANLMRQGLGWAAPDRREAYARVSREYEVVWQGRNYSRQDWGLSDPVNRALSEGVLDSEEVT